MEATSFLHEELKKIDEQINGKSSLEKRPLIFNLPELNLISIARAAATEKIFYFESKEEDLKVLGLGVSQLLDKNSARELLNSDSEALLFYSGNFEENENYCEIILPEWTFKTSDKKSILAVRTSSDFQSYSPSNLIFNQEVWESYRPIWTSYEESPEHDEWEKMIDTATKLFDENKLKKIVLSRKKIYKFDEQLEHLKFFEDFYLSNQGSSHFTFFYQQNPQRSFLSFTPEKLFSLRNHKLQTLSLAGSIARGLDPAHDEKQQQELIDSEKLTAEQDSVTQEISTLLHTVAKVVHVSPLKIMKLPYIFHRQRDIEAIIEKEHDAFDLIALLHPTPAVGGFPRTEAMTRIFTIEQSKRGPYAAPCGIISKHFSEIAVGIRSLIMDEAVMTIFGGAGIIKGSIAEEEWIETGLKMRPFLKVINQGLT